MNADNQSNLIDAFIVKKLIKPRDPFSNKGNYGHACIIVGSYGMMGAAVLSSKACLRSGVGKVTAFIPEIGYSILQTSIPEAMVKVVGKKIVSKINDVENFDAIGIGPGIGIHKSHIKVLQKIFSIYHKPMVIDADALNIISQHKKLLNIVPEYSIVTPHPIEFERLFGKCKSESERNDMALKMSVKYKIIIVVKGHETLITAPDKNVWKNTSGNPGMATAGSGDVLTGIITGFLAQGYSPVEAAKCGVYIHGLAGDIAAHSNSQNALIAGDIIDNFGKAFIEINKV